MNPLVSIITPTYNRPQWLGMTLQSLISQTYDNWECILINDAGQDVQNVVDHFNDPRIRYFQNEKNLDLAGTRNVGLAEMHGDYGMLLDDDDQLFPETLEFRLWRIDKLGVDVVYSKVMKNIYTPIENGYRLSRSEKYWDSPFSKDLILIQNISPCNGVLASRRAIESAGIFDTSLTTSEDWEFWVRMSRDYDFHETKIVDCQCSFRTDNSQMTGSRTGYSDHLPYLYEKWRKYAENLPWVIEHQNLSLKSRNLNPEDYNL